MSEPGKHSAEQPAVEAPRVTTAPAHGRLARIPSHLGRARTSTVVLGVLFLAIGALYLNIRPEPTAATPAAETGTEQPAPAPVTTSQVPEPTTEPTSEPTTTTAPPTSDVPTRTTGTTETTAPDTAVPEEPDETSAPTTTTAPRATTLPTTVSPPG